MRVTKKLLLLALAVPFALLSKANTGKNEGAVQGLVIDAITKKPIAGVVITLTGSKFTSEKEVSTDADGSFKIGKLPGGDLTLYFEKKGYKVQRREISNTKEGTVYKISLDMIPFDEEDDADEFSHPLLRMSGGMGE